MPKGVKEVYWVVGGDTDVGKTTISTALIRVLDRAGRKVCGFKPFASASLMSIYGTLIANRAASGSTVFGRDALRLASAASMTSADLADVVVPIQHISYPRHESTFIARSGSPTLGNARYYRKALPDTLMNRRDIRHLLATSKIPLETCSVFETLDFGEAVALGMDAPRRAFDHLSNLGAEVVVCEGAAGFLPIWQGGPPVTHLFVIDDGGNLNYIHNINLSMDFDRATPLQSTSSHLKIIDAISPRWLRSPIYLGREEDIDAMSENIVSEILRYANVA